MTRDEIFRSFEARWLKDVRFPAALKAPFTLEWLPGDASNRFYGRLHYASEKSVIIMMVNAPEAFKSEEVTGSDESKLQEMPFVLIDRAFETIGLRVPHIHYVDPKNEFMLLEDFGGELLYDRRQKDSAHAWYARALQELAKLQKATAFEPVRSRTYTRELLDWEAEHFVEYALEKNGKKYSAGALSEIRNFLKKAVEDISKAPQVMTHRDYHSKNLMILEQENQVGIIDFQDALMGPADYDLASLLRDSYVSFCDEEEEDLLRLYEEASGRRVDRRLFGLVSLQRNLKAVGRFFYIYQVKGKPTHLPYVAPTLRRVVRTLGQMKELRVLSLMEGIFADELRS
jgi:aminoglycoside/choline kinase family phosphotransferase